jgi:DNA-binding HxlR family transcriptional regulator
MAKKRSYDDPCGIARALDVVGERWALLVVRELLLGPKRFTDLRAGLPHVGPDVLSQRLRELEQAGLLTRRTLAPPAASKVYELTPRGAALEPVILALGRWGSGAPFPADHGSLGSDAFVLALKTLFDPAAAGELVCRVALHVSGEPFDVGVADRQLEVVRGEPPRADLVLTSDTATLASVMWHEGSLADALTSGNVVLDGSRRLAARFLACFPLTARAAAPA